MPAVNGPGKLTLSDMTPVDAGTAVILTVIDAALTFTLGVIVTAATSDTPVLSLLTSHANVAAAAGGDVFVATGVGLAGSVTVWVTVTVAAGAVSVGNGVAVVALGVGDGVADALAVVVALAVVALAGVGVGVVLAKPYGSVTVTVLPAVPDAADWVAVTVTVGVTAASATGEEAAGLDEMVGASAV